MMVVPSMNALPPFVKPTTIATAPISPACLPKNVHTWKLLMVIQTVKKTCQITANPPVNLCEDVDCGEGYMCVIEDPCNNTNSPTAIDCEERAACVPTPELETEETDPADEEDPQETDTEEMTVCAGDWDCEEGERCVFPMDEGPEEDINCGDYLSGTCVPSLF